MTTRAHADYIYRNKPDSLRVRVHRRANGRWDYDVFYPTGLITTYSDGAGDDFASKRAALADARVQHGPLYAIAVEGTVVDAAWYRRTTKSSRVHSSMKKTPSQLNAEIAEALRAEPPRYYRVTMHRNVEVMGPRRFWLRVILDSPKIVIGWELDQDGERTHRKHIIERALAAFAPARMNRTYATMEVIS